MREILRARADAKSIDPSEAAAMIASALGGSIPTPGRLAELRRTHPLDADALWSWIYAFTGIKLARTAVCPGHSAPFDMLAEQVLDRPSLSLWHGPRGGGKSFMAGLATHLTSRFNPRHDTHILGGSKAQSEQIYRALRDAVWRGGGPLGADREALAKLLKTEASYANGSTVGILAASQTSVRGPHVASLKLDEVDEIETDIRESAMGMAMDLRGSRASVLMTSTWHRTAGPMAALMEQGTGGDFPVHSFCVFEVLETCPPERSGDALEKCPGCPLMPWCHEGREQHPTGLPKAKRSTGHYGIDALIQKVRGVGPRVFESDYLCLRPRVKSAWFPEFGADNVATDDPDAVDFVADHPVHISIDCGVWTGAVLFQVFERPRRIHVFGEYLAEGVGAGAAAMAMLEMIRERAGEAKSKGLLRVSVDSAAGDRNPVGESVYSIYEGLGLTGSNGRIEPWDKYPGSVLDTLTMLEGFIVSASGSRALKLHPRCERTKSAIEGFRRKLKDGQPTDQPVDPQHPHEEMVDALRGGLSVEYPRRLEEPPAAPPRSVNLRRIFR